MSSHCADSQIADKSFDLIANTLNREVHRWRPTREAFSSSLSAVISEWPGAVKGMILFVMAKLPLTARTIRGQLSSRKRPPTAERNHCKQSRRVKPAGTHAGQYLKWGSQSWLPPAFSRRPDTQRTSAARSRGPNEPRALEVTGLVSRPKLLRHFRQSWVCCPQGHSSHNR